MVLCLECHDSFQNFGGGTSQKLKLFPIDDVFTLTKPLARGREEVTALPPRLRQTGLLGNWRGAEVGRCHGQLCPAQAWAVPPARRGVPDGGALGCPLPGSGGLGGAVLPRGRSVG